MKRLTAIFLAALLLFSLSACGETPPAPPQEPEEEAVPSLPTPSQEELEAAQIQELLDSMTTEELVGQLFFVRCPAENAAKDVSAYHLGGYILFGRDFKDQEGEWLTREQFVSNLESYQAAAAIPLLIGVDEEGGTVARVSRNPNLRAEKFKSPQELFDLGGKEAILSETAEKDALLKGLGINVNLAPVADVSTSPDDFIYDRSYGQDAASTADYVARVVAAMSADGMGSVVKHFPGYGNNVDTHTGIAIDERPMEQFLSQDLLPFESGIQAGEGKTAVLVSHNIINSLDAKLPASLSPAVHDLLRETLGGCVVMTDDLAMDAVAAYAQDGAVAVLALQAGNDLVLTTDYRTQIPLVIQAVEEGRLDQAQLKNACRRVLEWKQNLGLLPPVSPEV